ncbi:MAG: Spy/CpxP family protein refolding chaperone, partial [Planctomycetota bacterium]
MIRETSISILAMAVVAFLGGLIGSMSAHSGQEPSVPSAPGPGTRPLARCLGISARRMAEIDSRDATFKADLASLRAELAARRQALADALESPDSSDDEVRNGVERIIETHNTLERRVTEYLLVVRDELTPQQRTKLFRLCSEGVRGGHGRGWGRGGGRGAGRGRGMGGGRGRGHGRGRG